jgi:hypothetical protein
MTGAIYSVVGGGDQADVVRFGQAAALAPAAAVNPYPLEPVEQVAPGTALEADQGRHRDHPPATCGCNSAIQLSLAGRGRPRRLRSAEILPHVREVASSGFSTTTRLSHRSRSSRVRARGPQPRAVARCHSSPTATNVTHHAIPREPRGEPITKRAHDRLGRHIRLKNDVAPVLTETCHSGPPQ